MKRNAYSPKGICYYSQLMAFMNFFFSACGENFVKTLSFKILQISSNCVGLNQLLNQNKRRIPIFQKTPNGFKNYDDVRNLSKPFGWRDLTNYGYHL